MNLELVTFFSVVLNIICMAVGVGVFTCAVWILFDNETLLYGQPSVELHTVGVGMMVVGIVVMLISVIGCVAAVQKMKMLLLVCLGVFIVLVLGQIFFFMLLILNRFKIENQVDEELYLLMMEYRGNDTRTDDLIDNIQRYEKCCGSNGSLVWQENMYIRNLSFENHIEIFPCSCFDSTDQKEDKLCYETSTKGNLFKEGCSEKVKNWIFVNIVTVVAMIVGLVLLQMILFGLMACLYCSVEEEELKQPLVAADQENQDPVQQDQMPHGKQNNGYIGAADHGDFNPAHEDEPPYGTQNNGYMDADDHGDFDSVHEDELPHGKQNYGYAGEDDIDQDFHGY